MNRHLRAAVATAIEPALEAEGFVGSFPEYRRLEGHVLSMIWIQERSDRAGCCVNLGVHLDFLPAAPDGAKLPVLEEMTQPRCEIKKRLVPESELRDFWWDYADGERIADGIGAALAGDGFPFLRRLGDFPDGWTRWTPELLEGGDLDSILPGVGRARAALMLARVHQRFGSRDARDRFAECAVAAAGPMARRFIQARVRELAES